VHLWKGWRGSSASWAVACWGWHRKSNCQVYIYRSSRTVPGSIPGGVTGFLVTYSFRPHYGPRVDSAPSENEYQEHFLRVKAAGAWGLRLHHLHVPNVKKFWETKPPGTLWATSGLLRDDFVFYIQQAWPCTV